jgi:hypothetical protein
VKLETLPSSNPPIVRRSLQLNESAAARIRLEEEEEYETGLESVVVGVAN